MVVECDPGASTSKDPGRIRTGSAVTEQHHCGHGAYATGVEVLIRPASQADAAEIAVCHVTGWQAGVAGVVAAQYLSSLSVADSHRRWAAGLATVGHAVMVAVVDQQIAGFTRTGPSVAEPGEAELGVPSRGELRELYVRPDHWGTGVANQLHGAAVAALADSCDRAVLWVVEGNERALRFYRRRGWRLDGWVRTESEGPHSWTELRMAGVLAAQSGI